jgi:hypothetical protein
VGICDVENSEHVDRQQMKSRIGANTNTETENTRNTGDPKASCSDLV